MNKRVALIGIVVENKDAVEPLNALLHSHGEYIIGRMGLPYPQRGVSIISIAIDAPADVISALAGKLGMIPGVSSKTIYAKLPQE
ncbi:MAG: iron-only hydrogenase system regulator [Lentisphaerae bacterium]|jgi:putative iron-only hydrogenase system regulator|nr:iron-only hydrogenase system regulator [Lentisphaerota bacterium]